MKLWLVGSKGMLGTSLQEQAAATDGIELVGTDGELDIADLRAIQAFGETERPTHIVNCAAYTRVDDAESAETEATRVNGQGAANLALIARDLRSHFLHISTDYVFDGRADSPYEESEACAPDSAYGRSKLAGERGVLATGDDHHGVFVVRTSWLFGDSGHNFVSTMLGLFSSKQTVRVVADQVGRPTYASDLASVMLKLLGAGAGGGPVPESGIYHFANAGETTWHGFACGIREAALTRGIPITTGSVMPVSTAEFPRPAPRPKYSVLATEKIEATLAQAPRPWQEALDAYMDRAYGGASA